MTLICQPPIQPTGVVIKESGPKVIRFSFGDLNPEQNELTPDTVHSVQFYLGIGEVFKVAAAQTVKRINQDLVMHFWVSKQPYGMVLPNHWRNLNVISLLNDPTLIYVAEKSFNKYITDPSLIISDIGLHYVNIHNRSGKLTYYRLDILSY